MGVELGRKHDQGPLSQTIRDLDEKNGKFNGMLFSTLRSGRQKVRIFPTPLSRIIDNRDVDGFKAIVFEFLVVTVDGYKAIQADTGGKGFASAETIGNLIKERLGKKPTIFSNKGYLRGWECGTVNIGGGLRGTFFIAQDRATRFSSDAPYDFNCRLVEIDKNRVEQILQANIERVRKLQTTSQRISGVLKTF